MNRKKSLYKTLFSVYKGNSKISKKYKVILIVFSKILYFWKGLVPMNNLYESEVLIYTEELPSNIAEQVSDYISETNTEKQSFKISKEKIKQEEIEKFPEASVKFSIKGDCANWNEEFRQIIKMLRMYTICVLIL